ncbi:MAG: hypothetical protein K1W21_02385 [Oscillospiraceae bacterium]
MAGIAGTAAVLAGKISVLGMTLLGAAAGAAIGALWWLWTNRKGRK